MFRKCGYFDAYQHLPAGQKQNLAGKWAQDMPGQSFVDLHVPAKKQSERVLLSGLEKAHSALYQASGFIIIAAARKVISAAGEYVPKKKPQVFVSLHLADKCRQFGP